MAKKADVPSDPSEIRKRKLRCIRNVSAFLLVIVSLYWITAPRVTKLGAGGQRCPFGHTTIRAVPVVYGLSMRIDDAELQKYKNHELVGGGCCVSPNSPRYAGYCTACGFGYDPMSRMWGKSADDKTTFTLAFSWPIDRYPVPARAHTEYHQLVFGGRVLTETLYWNDAGTTPTFQKLKGDYEAFFKANGAKNFRVTETNAAHVEYAFEIEGKTCSGSAFFGSGSSDQHESRISATVSVGGTGSDRIRKQWIKRAWQRPDYEVIDSDAAETVAFRAIMFFYAVKSTIFSE